MLKELHLSTTTLCPHLNEQLSEKVVIIAIEGAIELTLKMISSSSAHLISTDISSVKLDGESKTQPVVIIACHENVNFMTHLCESLESKSLEPLCVILSESENQCLYNLPISKTQVLNDKDKLYLYVNDLLERFAFEKVYYMSMLLNKIELAAENASTETSTRWKQDYIFCLRQLELVLDGNCVFLFAF